MTSTLRRVATLFMIFAVVTGGMAAFAGSAAATSHTTTLAGDGTDTVTDFNASEDEYLEYSLSSSGTDFGTDGTSEVKINVTYNNKTYYKNASTNVASADTSYLFNFSEGELSDLPGDAGENTTVTVNAWGTDGNGTVTTTTQTFDVPITFDNTYAVAEVDDDSATIEDVEPSGWNTFSLGILGNDDPADRHTYESTVGIDGSNTTVTVLDETTNGSDAFSDAIREDIESGDVIYGASVGVNGTPVKAFYDEADTDKISDGDTYAIYNSDANTWVVETGDAQDGATEMDVYISSQSYTAGDTFEQADLNSLFISDLDMGLYSLFSNFGSSAFGSFSMTEAVGIGMVVPAGGLAAGLFAFGRPTIDA